MAIGKRIKFFHNRKGITQKQLSEIFGFLGKTSDVRIPQYEYITEFLRRKMYLML